MDHLSRAGARTGLRMSLRAVVDGAPGDVVGLVVALTDDAVELERRGGVRVRLARSDVTAARIVPLVARGRNPHHFDPEQVRRLAHDPLVGGHGPVWVGRLADLVDSLDVPGVTRGDPARVGASAVRVFGEWATIALARPDDLRPLAAWAARHDARNVAVTGAADGVRGLAPLRADG